MDSLLCIVLYLYGWLSCLNYTLGNSWWFLSRLVFFKLFVLSPQFSKSISLFFFFRSLCSSSTNLLAFFAYGHSLHGEWPLTSHLSEWKPPVILYTVFPRGAHSEHYCDHFNVDRWIYYSVILSSPFDGSWLCKNLNKWMSILFKEKQKYHATEEIILSDAV